MTRADDRPGTQAHPVPCSSTSSSTSPLAGSLQGSRRCGQSMKAAAQTTFGGPRPVRTMTSFGTATFECWLQRVKFTGAHKVRTPKMRSSNQPQSEKRGSSAPRRRARHRDRIAEQDGHTRGRCRNGAGRHRISPVARNVSEIRTDVIGHSRCLALIVGCSVHAVEADVHGAFSSG